MESRFAHLRQRDTSVSMLRVKMSRRRSQSQKENRQRAVNTRRQLDELPEMDTSSLDASMAVANMSTTRDKTQNHAKPAKNLAVEERLKQLERWKERKALEKEKRERERKCVFKTGLYQPRDAPVNLPAVPALPKKAKEIKVNPAPPQNTRVTRSMKQQQAQKPLRTQDSNAAKKAQPAVERPTRSRVAPAKAAPVPTATKTKLCTVEPVVRAPSTRSTSRPPVTAVPLVKDKPKDKAADVRNTRSRAAVKSLSPPSDRKGNSEASGDTVQTPVSKEPEMQEPEDKWHLPSPTLCSKEEDMVVDQATADSVPAVESLQAPNSFAPEGFVFQAPAGLSSFKFEPLTPRSADAFLTPSSSFTLPPAPIFSAEPKSPHRSPPPASPTVAPPTPADSLESKADVPYFRSEIAKETDRLTALCIHWEPKVEDESIPEEMRDRMRTAVGQARLLMKERFHQFSGLVDDCELGRGEKITTCSDLQGFWDMVYYQVEDVNKKFDALREAEGRGWVEEHKPPPRQRKVVKKPSAGPSKPTGTKAAAKSRLAAVKAAMKAKQQAAEAEKAAKDAGNVDADACLDTQESQDPVVASGGSPAKPLNSVRRSSRLSAAVLPQASPCSSSLTPRRVTRRSLALAQTPVQTTGSPAQPVLTPAHLSLALDRTPAAPEPQSVHLCLSPLKEVLSADSHPDGSGEQSAVVSTQDNTASVELGTLTPVHSLPTISVVEEQGSPAAVPLNLPLCPRLSLSPPRTPPSFTHPSKPSSLSFMLSPCATPGQPSISSPAAVQGPVEAQDSVCRTPDSSVVEEMTELDLRYFQPSQRCSLSPRETVTMETSSPLTLDVEMESPRGQPEDVLTALPAVPSVLTLQSPQVQTAESALLLFTPDLKDRIRQSVCPTDLMVFTPPSNV